MAKAHVEIFKDHPPACSMIEIKAPGLGKMRPFFAPTLILNLHMSPNSGF